MASYRMPSISWKAEWLKNLPFALIQFLVIGVFIVAIPILVSKRMTLEIGLSLIQAWLVMTIVFSLIGIYSYWSFYRRLATLEIIVETEQIIRRIAGSQDVVLQREIVGKIIEDSRGVRVYSKANRTFFWIPNKIEGFAQLRAWLDNEFHITQGGFWSNTHPLVTAVGGVAFALLLLFGRAVWLVVPVSLISIGMSFYTIHFMSRARDQALLIKILLIALSVGMTVFAMVRIVSVLR